IMKMQIAVGQFRAIERLPPGRAEPVACPGFAEAVAQDRTFGLFRSPGIEHFFEWCPNGDHDPLFPFPASLLVRLQANMRSIVLRPRNADQRPLSLATPQGEQ